VAVKPECLTAFKKDLAKRHPATAKQNNKLFCETRSCRNGFALPEKKATGFLNERYSFASSGSLPLYLFIFYLFTIYVSFLAAV